jgi:hypothetical protein
MASMSLDLPVVYKAGADFTFHAGELAQAVRAFAAAAQIPSSAVGVLGPGQDALKAYGTLLAHVTESLQQLHQAVHETGTCLTQGAAACERQDLTSARQANSVAAAPG